MERNWIIHRYFMLSSASLRLPGSALSIENTLGKIPFFSRFFLSLPNFLSLYIAISLSASTALIRPLATSLRGATAASLMSKSSGLKSILSASAMQLRQYLSRRMVKSSFFILKQRRSRREALASACNLGWAVVQSVTAGALRATLAFWLTGLHSLFYSRAACRL